MKFKLTVRFCQIFVPFLELFKTTDKIQTAEVPKALGSIHVF